MDTNESQRAPKCADLVAQKSADTIDTIRLMLCPTEDDVTVNIGEDGALLSIDGGEAAEVTVDPSYLEGYEDSDGEVDEDQLISDHFDELREQAYERWHEYGLSFDYVDGDGEHFFRYQISWGGPSSEFRFFANHDLTVYRVEFWYMDWFDGACVNVTNDDTVCAVWDQFSECGTAEHVRAKALEA